MTERAPGTYPARREGPAYLPEHRGNHDPLNTRLASFPSPNDWGIPLVRGPTTLPEALVPYTTRLRERHRGAGLAVHFFLDDQRFEPVWSYPNRALSRLELAGCALSPDFSVYADHPRALQLYNVYRNRWCGAFWASKGVAVIPTVSWSDERSWAFCFEGVQAGGVVAISTVGVSSRKRGREASGRATERFASGYAEMVRRLMPRAILVYGERTPAELLSDVGEADPAERFGTLVRRYPTRWEGIRRDVRADARTEPASGS